MRTICGRLGRGAAIAGLAAALAFPLPRALAAREGASPADPPAPVAAGVEIPAGEAAPCAKCHSACEDGRVHEGLAPAAPPPGTALPLDAEGRATCTTCHAPHEGGDPARGARLRLSNHSRELCLACHREGTGAGPRLRIVSPPERSVVQEERLALIGTASGLSGDSLLVRFNGVPFHLPVRGEEVLTWLKLRDGVNSIEVSQGDLVLWQGEVFRADGAPGTYARMASAHQTASRQQCRACHDDAGGPVPGGDGDDSTLCYECHDRYEGKRYLHGPIAVGACLACHDPHGGFSDAHLRRDQSLLCADCHAGRELAAKSACSAEGKACADCHDPHQSDSRYLLKGPKYTGLAPIRAAGRR